MIIEFKSDSGIQSFAALALLAACHGDPVTWYFENAGTWSALPTSLLGRGVLAHWLLFEVLKHTCIAIGILMKY